MPTYGSNLNTGEAAITLSAAEHRQFLAGKTVYKITESAQGKFLIGTFMVESPLVGQMSLEEAKKRLDKNNRIQFNVRLDIEETACLNDDSLDSLNNLLVDEYLPTEFIGADISYEVVGVYNGEVVVRVDCDVSDSLDELDGTDE